jgi:2-polyprenyl-6-methoxyphenol hydroxylase-like FAD-dependent oxidoreductase
LARAHQLLRDRAPDVLDALLDAGATELRFTDNLPPTLTDFEPRPGDEELVAIACRRTTFEWVLRRVALAEPAVELRHGEAAVGLVAEVDAGETPRVRGLRVQAADGREEVIDADLVVDARGPRSSGDDWLAAIGAREVPEQLHESGIVYLSRFYRLEPGEVLPETTGPVAADLGYLKFAVFVGDNRTFSMTFAVDADDESLRRRLAHVEPFEAAVLALPLAAPWRTEVRAEPLTDVHVMAGLRNRYRPLVVDGEPLVVGYVAAGDASVCTNPLYGRGCSLALVHGFGLADTLRATDGDGDAFAREFAAFTERELVPWFRAAIFQDAQSREAPAAPAAESPSSGEDPREFVNEIFREGLLPAVRTSPVVYRAFLKWFNLLASPEALMGDGEVIAAVLAVYQDRDNRPPAPVLGPDRAAFESALTS